ncbi:MAG TPA: hypothetical protein VK907_04955 [Phnomibacter sp.]|nr:hypothetical protein [Phnomibacter sp.]
MLKEQFQQILLDEAYQNESVNIYDFAQQHVGEQPDIFGQVRPWSHQLVKDKLAIYLDPEHTVIQITNYGKFWMVHGGYMAYLREEHFLKEKRNMEKEQHQEKLLEARLKLTHYRLLGFWVALVVSLLGFTLSIINLFLYFGVRK